MSSVKDKFRLLTERIFRGDLAQRTDQVSVDIRALRDEFLAKNRHLHAHTVKHVRAARPYVDHGTQFLMSEAYRKKAEENVILPFRAVEFSNHSQNGEDGVLHYVFSLIGTTNRIVVEISAGTCDECNATNLILNQNWFGLLFEGNANKLKYGRDFFRKYYAPHEMPRLVEAWVTRGNINDLIVKHGVEGQIDLLSLDVDGIDYWLLDALTAISPRVMVIEAQYMWGPEKSVTVPYKDDFEGKMYLENEQVISQHQGASINAFVKLCKRRNYRLIGGVGRSGPNIIFMRNDIGRDYFPTIDPTDLFAETPAFFMEHLEKSRKIASAHEWVEV